MIDFIVPDDRGELVMMASRGEAGLNPNEF